MNNRISLPMLAKSLAADSGRTRKVCEDFLRELFSICSEALAAGEDVKVRGLGTFRIIDVDERKSVNVATGTEFLIPGHKKISFIPASTLADAVNYAFDMFEPVEVSDSVSSESLEALTPPTYQSSDQSTSSDEPTQPTDHSSIDQSTSDDQTPTQPLWVCNPQADPTQTDSAQPDSTQPDSSSTVQPLQIVTPQADPTQSDPSQPDPTLADSCDQEENTSPRKIKNCKFCWGVLTGFVGALILLGVAYLIYTLVINRPDIPAESVVAEEVTVAEDTTSKSQIKEEAPVDSAVHNAIPEDSKAATEVDTNPSDMDENALKAAEISVTDVISTTRFLTTMAREHYGNDAFWPYIYEENKSFLRHPDRIKPGTKVVVPPLSKYGVNPKSPSDIRKAKRLGVEIYNRYSK